MTHTPAPPVPTPAELRLLKNGDNEFDAVIDVCADTWEAVEKRLVAARVILEDVARDAIARNYLDAQGWLAAGEGEMTPETPTPETLRKDMSVLCRWCGGSNEGGHRGDCQGVATAAAWEACEQARHTAEVAAGVYRNSDAALRKRAEEAGKAILDALAAGETTAVPDCIHTWTHACDNQWVCVKCGCRMVVENSGGTALAAQVPGIAGRAGEMIYTHETLRAAFSDCDEAILPPGSMTLEPASKVADAHADAWQMKEAALAAAERQGDLLEAVIDYLEGRTGKDPRLEAAEEQNVILRKLAKRWRLRWHPSDLVRPTEAEMDAELDTALAAQVPGTPAG